MGPSRIAIVSAALTLGAILTVLPVQVAGAQPPSTTVIIPSNNATASGTSQVLDAIASAGTTQVQYEITGGVLTDSVIATATPTYYGWVALWNTTGVPNGTYTLQSVASSEGVSGTSSSVTIIVNNPPPSTAVVLPQDDAIVNAGTGLVFDAIASPGVTQVLIELVNQKAVSQVYATWTAVPTIYGWVVVVPPCGSCATGNPVPVSGFVSMVSVATYSDGVSGTSPPVPVTLVVYTTPPS
jgi:hypothetical protein